jgi:hypothetical protein
MYPDRTLPAEGDVIELSTGDIAVIDESQREGKYIVSVVAGLETGKCRRLDSADLEYNLETGRAHIVAGRTASPRERWWVEGRSPPAPNITASDLTFKQTTSRTRVNQFLDHPLVDHKLGSVAKGKAMFVATAGATDSIAAVAVLDRPARAIDDYQRLTLSRFASHPAAPPNTASWMISRICRWATVHGYRSLRTYAGVSNDNEGTIYQASGFTFEGTTKATGEGFANREGRRELDTFERRTYYRPLATAGIRVPAPDTDLPVDVPESHRPPFEPARMNQDNLEGLSTYLDTEASRQRRTLTETTASEPDEFLSPDDVGLVDFEHNPGLVDRLVTPLAITERATLTRQTADGTAVPTDSLFRGGPSPTAILGAHHRGELTTAVVIHTAGDLVAEAETLPDTIAPTDHVVTSYTTTTERGKTNVAAWLLATARKRAALQDATLYTAGSLSSIKPAAKRATVSTCRIQTVARISGTINTPNRTGQ